MTLLATPESELTIRPLGHEDFLAGAIGYLENQASKPAVASREEEEEPIPFALSRKTVVRYEKWVREKLSRWRAARAAAQKYGKRRRDDDYVRDEIGRFAEQSRESVGDSGDDAALESPLYVGGPGHRWTPEEADNAILEKWRKYIGAKEKLAGNYAAEHSQWHDHESFVAVAMARGRSRKEAENCSGMAFKKPLPPLAILDSESTDTASAVHEALHLYQHDQTLVLGVNWVEGLTEYFLRGVVLDAGNDRPYQQEFEAVQQVVHAIGEESSARAYFGGHIDEIKRELAKSLGKEAYRTVRKAMKKKNWGRIKKLLSD